MERYFLAAMQGIAGLGSIGIRRLLEYFDTAERLWHCPAEQVRKSGILSAKVLDKFLQYRQNFEIQSLQDCCEKKNISIITIFDNEYPKLLKNIYNPPNVLFCRGDLKKLAKPLAMVGARRFTPYGKNVALTLAQELAQNGYTIVSGAAYGIDSFAHAGALRSGSTVAVLGCGVDIAYPRENERLLEKIAQNGAIISEYLPGTRPCASFFPARNRIISGMSYGTIVVEAAKRSGSLITAEYALNEGRDVFAVPGSIYAPGSAGCNYLIQQGAKLVTATEDILCEYGAKPAFCPAATKKLLTAEEKKIYDILSYEQGTSTDKLIYKLRVDISHISFILLQMKLKGIIEQTPQGTYVLSAKE